MELTEETEVEEVVELVDAVTVAARPQRSRDIDDERLGGFTAALSFGIGASGTGVPFHVHGPGFSEVLWGRKRWFLTHKDEKPDFSPDETTLMWLRTRYYSIMQSDFRGKLFECTIGPGEALYFPDHWWHATLNIGETVFMSTFT